MERSVVLHEGENFIPMALECLGGWSQDLIFVVNAIGRLQAQQLGSDPSETTQYLAKKFQSLFGKEMPHSGPLVASISGLSGWNSVILCITRPLFLSTLAFQACLLYTSFRKNNKLNKIKN